VSDKDREFMRLIDEIHLEEPYLGTRGISNELRDKGYTVGRSHVRTLMRKMGIEALYQKPRLSEPHPGHTIYPYLLRGLTITEANHVWAADITYIPMARGFCYLVAIMDWASRKVLSFRLSNTLDTSFCTEARRSDSNAGHPDIQYRPSSRLRRGFIGILARAYPSQRTAEAADGQRLHERPWKGQNRRRIPQGTTIRVRKAAQRGLTDNTRRVKF
jgi:putative transposase